MDEIARLPDVHMTSTQQDIERRIDLLHSVGALVHFNVEGIRDLVIFNPDWLAKVSQATILLLLLNLIT